MGGCASAAVKEPTRVVLIGPSGVGKSTLLKQIKLLHARGFDAEELRRGAASIHRMLLDTLQVLLRNNVVQAAIGDAGIDACEAGMGAFTNIDGSADERAALLALIRAHWQGDAVRDALERLRHDADHDGWLRSNEWLQWWLDEAARVLGPNYEATPDDMLRLRRPTSGAHELPFTMAGPDGRDHDFVLVDMGGQVHEMKTWAAELEKPSVGGAVFMCSLADFDRTPANNSWASSWSVMRRDTHQDLNSTDDKLRARPNLLEHALRMLNGTLAGCPALQRVPLVVMLNKSDLFDDRIASGASKFYKYFPRCPKKVARKPCKARTWLAKQVEAPTERNAYLTSPHSQQVSCFATCAIHTDQAQVMVERIMASILSGAVSVLQDGAGGLGM